MKRQQADRDGTKKPKSSKQEATVSLLNGWQNFSSPQVPFDEKFAQGKRVREQCPRSEHGRWKAAEQRDSPIDLLSIQDKARVEHLIPYRYGRMMQSAFAFYRGGALIMARDLAATPHTNLFVQLCGDCHLSNFGIFATPERNVIFDLNDFDETLPGPFEWDLKRLAASFAVAAQDNGFTKAVSERCVLALAKTYRRKMEEFAHMNSLDIWYARVDWEYLVNRLKKPGRKQTAIDNLAKLKDKRNHAGALSKLTEVVAGRRRIKDDPPFLYHSEAATQEVSALLLQSYSQSLWQSRQRLLERYRFVDIAAKIVGVGSVGTVAGIILLQGEGGDQDQIFLQIKEAGSSVLEKYLGNSQFDHSGERIVNGQRLLQSASDMFLGWTSGTKRAFYIRQLMDAKASVAIDELDAVTLEQYAEVCAFVLARAHARSGDPIAIHGYLGTSDTFDQSLSSFAHAYAKQNEMDYAMLVDAIDKGKVKASAVDK